MGKARDAYGLVLGGLRARLRAGIAPPGEVLGIGELAAAYRTSATPVREALARLAGEGLLVEVRGRGFIVPTYDAGGLIALYDLHESQVALALRSRRTDLRRAYSLHAELSLELSKAGQAAPADAAAALFEAVVKDDASAPLTRAHASTSAQLGPAQRAEAIAFPDFFDELLTLALAFDTEGADDVRGRLGRYHDRRRTHAATLMRNILELPSKAEISKYT